MTSKEKIVVLLNTYEAYANAYCDDNDIMKFNYDKANYTISKYDLEEVKEIIKDLEVLDIIRKKITYHINPFGEGYIGYVITDDVEEFDLIKEWLNNGKD